jgi:hypothetical protein
MNPVTNLVLAVASAFGLLLTLGLPWYAPTASSPNLTDGPVERTAWKVGHLFGTNVDGLISGREGLANGETTLLVLCAIVIGLAVVVAAIPALRTPAEDGLRIVGLLAPVVVAYLALDKPDSTAGLSIHYGIIVALAVSILMASSCWHGSSMRQRRKAPSAFRMSAR